jgi:hypothetical protein
MHQSKYSGRIIIFLLCAISALYACKKSLDFKDVILITGTETSKVTKFTVETLPSSYAVTATATRKVEENITVNFEIDTSLVAVYNKEMSANYYSPPPGSFAISGTTSVIEAGTSVSKPLSVRILSTSNFIDGRSYIIPVTIRSVTGPLSVLEPSRTIYLRVARVTQFNSINIANFNFYHSFPFQTPYTNVKAFTYEIKCYIDQWHPGSNQISRLSNWGPVDESMFNLLRFGEAGSQYNQLQWINSSGQCFSNTLFTTGKWYTLSCVYNGSTCRLYIDGVLDNSFDATGQVYTFGALELGMSFAGYENAQRFLGRIAEVRFWNRPLSRTDIQEGLCGVDAAAGFIICILRLTYL